VTYLPNFAHDIFVSYGRGPEAFGGRRDFLSKWTRKFVDDLASQLDIILGNKEASRRVDIWMDQSALQGNQPLSPELQKSIDQSALLLVVMSDYYLKSQWCKHELEWFNGRGSDKVVGRVFVVKAFNTDRATWPGALRPEGSDLVGYPFYSTESADDTGMPLGWPEPDESDKEYWKQLLALGNQIASELKRREWAEKTPEAAPHVPDRVGRTVFLGYMHDSLQELRGDLRQRLDKAGLKIFPPADEDPVDESSLLGSFERYLPTCEAIILVANQYSERWPKGQLGGPLGLQLEHARKRRVPAYLWLQADDLGSVKYEQYREFLTSLQADVDGKPDVLIRLRDADAFVDYINQNLDRPSAPPPGVEQFAVVCSNAKPGQPYEDFQDRILEMLAETDRSCIIADQDQGPDQIRLLNLRDEISRADTLLVLCFDQDWRWAMKILPQIRQLVDDRKEKKKLFVVGPKYQQKGQFVTGFKFQTIVGVTQQNVVQMDVVADQIKKALNGAA
jgi:hypothetical protein